MTKHLKLLSGPGKKLEKPELMIMDRKERVNLTKFAPYATDSPFHH